MTLFLEDWLVTMQLMKISKIKVEHGRLANDSYVGYGYIPEPDVNFMLFRHKNVDNQGITDFESYLGNFIMQTSPVVDIMKKSEIEYEIQTLSGSLYRIEVLQN